MNKRIWAYYAIAIYGFYTISSINAGDAAILQRIAEKRNTRVLQIIEQRRQERVEAILRASQQPPSPAPAKPAPVPAPVAGGGAGSMTLEQAAQAVGNEKGNAQFQAIYAAKYAEASNDEKPMVVCPLLDQDSKLTAEKKELVGKLAEEVEKKAAVAVH